MRQGKEVGPECRRQIGHPAAWPAMLRTIYGDKERYKKQYWSEFKGSYFTGDGARRDKDGYFWIVGRIDDVLNVAGHRLGTSEIESALVSHASVAEAAVVGRPDELKGQGVVAFVTLKGGVEADAWLEGRAARSCRHAHRRDRQAGRGPFCRGAAENAQRKNHAPSAEGNRQRQDRHRRHDDAGRLQRSGEAERGRVTSAFFTSVESKRRPLLGARLTDSPHDGRVSLPVGSL